MTKSLIAGIAIVVVSGVFFYLARRKSTGKMLNRVSEEGYETAHDILFPRQKHSRKLRFGPILPYNR